MTGTWLYLLAVVRLPSNNNTVIVTTPRIHVPVPSDNNDFPALAKICLSPLDPLVFFTSHMQTELRGIYPEIRLSLPWHGLHIHALLTQSAALPEKLQSSNPTCSQ